MDAAHVLVARQSNGDNTGSHRNSQGSSVSAFLSTLIPVLLISSAVFLAFLLLRQRYPRVYFPRTYLPSLRNWQRSPEQTAGVLGWRKEYAQLKDEFVMDHASIDNYLWLRFLRILALMCFVGCLITWPILFPINATGTAGNDGLDILSFSNITPGPRYYAQVFVSWAFLAWVMFVITREAQFFIRLRQQYYLTPYQSHRISTRTVLFVNVPEASRNDEHLRREFAGVKSVWLVNVPEELAEKVSDRDAAAAKLENGEVKLIQNYIKRQIKLEKKGQGDSIRSKDANGNHAPITLDKNDRPMGRLPRFKSLPFGSILPTGKKVDTVDWSRQELARLVPEVAEEQSKLRGDQSHAQAACFVEFDTVQAAVAAMRSGSIKDKVKSKTKMTPKELGPTPENIIWKNTIKSSAKVHSFKTICTAFIWFLCIFWTIPVAVIGAITNINYLTDNVSFLSFIDDIPSVILGVVTGLLPVILLAVLMSLVPIICTIMAKLFEPTQSAVQMRVQGWYFPFQVIQVFLVTTFASGAASVASQIVDDPSSAATLLAQNLPKASNFYISYFILFGLQTAAMQLLNVVPLLFAMFLGKILDKTPRKMYNRYVNLAGLGWGSLYPKFTNLGVIALSYSCIAPLVLGFAAVGFTLLYLAFRYSALFTLGTNVSTCGHSYGRALQQLATGIYLSEVCLIGLFAIGIGQTTQSIGPLVLMIIFLVATIAWHIWLRRSLSKLDEENPDSNILSNGTHQSIDLEKSASGKGDMHSDGPNTVPPKQLNPPNPASGGGLMARIKGYFSPLAAADHTIAAMSNTLSVPSRPYTQQEHDEAYIHPAIISECPRVWIARDKYGLSQQEIHDSRKEVGEGLEIFDDGAVFNEKGKVEWTSEKIEEAPIWRDQPQY